MNKNAIQHFAIWARTELIFQVSQRAYQYDITADGYGDYNSEIVAGRLLYEDEKKQRRQLISQIRSKGYAQVMEEVAYTWFNRFIALRFMEINNYLPTHIRVFSDASGAFKPEILSNALHLDLQGLDMEKVSNLIEKNQTEDLYRYLLLTQCNALSVSLPRMFERMGSYTELLLPNNILRQDGVLGRMVTDIPEEDWTDQVQIIGWLYQYYNTELNEVVYDGNMSKDRIPKELLPAATTIYTPDWAVRYMVENSLGRLWIEGHPDDELKAGWKYYLDEAEQEADVQAQLEKIRAEYRALRPQDIKVIDPCMGSGHILVYAFDVLVQIYKRVGFSERDAAQNILENNLYGLDIDNRATQLAYFAVMMKARQYDRRIFTRNIQPHVYTIVESNGVHISAMWRLGSEQEIAERLVAELKDAKEYGSILNLSLTLDELTVLRKRLMEINEMSGEGNLMDMMDSSELFNGLFPFVEVASVMVQKYNVIITNPPYLGSSRFSSKIDKYVKTNYQNEKSDLSMVMYKKALQGFCKQDGLTAFITTSSWMFLSSFEKLRMYLNQNTSFVNLTDYGTELFDGKVGHNPIVAWITRKTSLDYKMRAVRLVDYCYSRRDEKEPEFFKSKNRYIAKQSNFYKIPGSTVAYWVSDNIYQVFDRVNLSKKYDIKAGISTGDNGKFILYWHEIEWEYCKVLTPNDYKYTPHNKGGDYRKWYGNRDVILKYSPAALADMEHNAGFRHDGKEYYFREHIGWSKITSGAPSFRYFESGFTFDSAGLGLFPVQEQNIYVTLAFLNSKVAEALIALLNPTLNVTPMVIKKLPFTNHKDLGNVSNLTQNNIALSKEDWDSFETSWDFRRHPLVRDASTVWIAFAVWERECEERFQTIKANEEELNRIFIDIYGLQDELTPKVEDRDVTVRRADLGRDIRLLISYAVGCMFGRYSLDTPGLAYAGGEWENRKYNTYLPDKDNIIPICDDDYFGDDITDRFVKWVEVVFGKETLEENLKYIADALGGKGTPREIIRNYFLNGFYVDHLKTYQKRPIYWLFDSGKKNGFKALIYMHRYQSDLLARMRTDYVHEQQERYRTQLGHIGEAMNSALASERVKLAKQQKKLQEQALELQKYEEKIHHLADKNIKIDLDDGVVHNYELFADVLAKRK